MTIFSKIIQGDIPSYKIYEDEFCYAFLDIKPQTLGHTLLVPKVEEDHLMNLDAMYSERLMIISQKLSKAIQKATGSKRVALMVVGFDVPHVHIHLIPINKTDDILPENAHNEEKQLMLSIQKSIIAHLDHA